MGTNNERKGAALSVRAYEFRSGVLALSFRVADGSCGEEIRETVYLPCAMVFALANVCADFVSVQALRKREDWPSREISDAGKVSP
jgi:hypothetical protein